MDDLTVEAGPEGIVDLDELQAQAQARLEPMTYDYFAGGSETETTLRDNVDAWRRWRLRPRVLRDVSEVSMRTTLLGEEVATPVMVAPAAYQGLAHPDGEAATARGAAAAGALMVVSTLATTSLEDVMGAAPDAPKWFQLYVFEELGYAEELLHRARESGYRAVALTVDAPVLGHRPRDERNRFHLPAGMKMANVPRELPAGHGSGLAALFTSHDRSLTFDDLAWVRETAQLPLVVKGVLRGDDARACVDAGADAVVVSNHGGRQVDAAVATADALPEVVEAVAGRAEVYVDGGIRHGADIVTALALGARGVLVGRPVLWGLACDGDEGVRAVLGSLTALAQLTLTMSGVTDAADVPRDLVRPAP